MDMSKIELKLLPEPKHVATGVGPIKIEVLSPEMVAAAVATADSIPKQLEPIVPYGPVIASFDVALVTMAVCIMTVNPLGQIRILHWDLIPLMGRSKKTRCTLSGCCLKSCWKDLRGNTFCMSHKSFASGRVEPYVTTVNVNHSGTAILLGYGMDKYPHLQKILDSDIIVIETQPKKNQKMVWLSHFMNMYFMYQSSVLGKGKIRKVDYFQPKNKTKHWTGAKVKKTKKSAYDQRKLTSSVICEGVLRDGLVEQNARWLSFFNRQTKKDDYADAFNQGLTYSQSYQYKL